MQSPKKSFPKTILALGLIVVTVSVVIALWATPELIGPPSPNPNGTFHLSASPTNLFIPRGFSGNSTITLTSISGFTGGVNLSTVFSGSGLAVALSPVVLTLSASGTGTSFLTISVGSSTNMGQYNVTITGTSGTISASTAVYLTVQ